MSVDCRWRNRRLLLISQCGIVGIFYLLVYASVIAGLITDWYGYDIYSYGHKDHAMLFV